MTPPGSSTARPALEQEAKAVDAALRRALDALDEDVARVAAGVDTGVDAERFLETARYGVLGGGKRIRPILCVTAFRACGGAPTAPIHDLAAAVELIHAYSLMHDDLPCMDDAELRRGRPTTHRMHGEVETMVAAGALIVVAAVQAWRASGALALDDDRRRSIVRALMSAAGASGMVGGQALDLLGEDRDLDEEALTRLHGLKTGALLAVSPAIGARAAEASMEVVEAMERYGRELGLGFQIADDVLDATGTAEALGKEPSDDALRKSTYVALFGVEGARRMAEACRERAEDALREAGIHAPLLESLAEYAVRRRM